MKLYDVIRKEQTQKVSEPLVEVFVPTSIPQHKRKKYILFFGLVLGILVTIYLCGLYFVRTTVSIEERSIPFTLEETVIELSHETQSDTKRLSFQTMTVTSEIRREIFGSELREVTGKSKGSVVFFNEYSTAAQTIKSGTKLVASNGKQYISQQTAVIPGYKMEQKKKIPGTSPSVPIVAIETGPASNSDGTSLTISGYTGTKKIQLYARSVGAFSGGEEGMRHTVSEADRPQLVESLKTQLSERLRRETRAQIPEHLLTYPDLQFISVDANSLKLEGEGVKFTAQIKGTMVSYLISRDLLESAIAKDVLSDHTYTSVSIPTLNSLVVTPQSSIPANADTVPESISIKVSGQGTIITKAPVENIQESLIGAPRSSFDKILTTFPEISSATFRIIPFWAPFFPKERRHITVEL